MSDRKVLITEQSKMPLSTVSQSGKLLEFKGTFAVMDVVNNNNRIYTESEYMPCIERLKNKIQKGLLGELNHPDRFDIDPNNASHMVTEIGYDKANKTVWGKIRLLNTPKGQIAKALFEGGYPMYISSRASGSVGNDKKVKLQEIYTYDIVAEPGFSQAKLDVINESLSKNGLNMTVDEAISMLNENRLNSLSENFGIFDENIRIYDMGVYEKEINTHKNEIFNNKMSEFLERRIYDLEKKVDKMQSSNESKFKKIAEHSNYLVEQIQQINRVNENSNISSNPKLEKYVNYLAEQMQQISDKVDGFDSKFEQTIGYANYLGEQLDKSIRYSEHIAKVSEKLINYADYLGESTGKVIKYTNYLAENINKQGSSKKLDKLVEYCNILAGKIEESIKYSEYIAEKADKGIQYTEHVAKHTGDSINYVKYLGEKLNQTVNYAEMLAEKIGQNIEYTEHVAEWSNKGIKYMDYLAEKINEDRGLMESTTQRNPSFKRKIGKESFDEIVEKSKREKTFENQMMLTNPNYALLNESQKNGYKEEMIREQKISESYPFYIQLSESHKKVFKNLTDTQRVKVAVEIAKNANSGKRGVEEVFESVLGLNGDSNLPKFIKNMPSQYKPIFEKLSTSEKDRIVAESKFYKLETPLQIENFWQNRKLEQTLELERISEGKSLNEHWKPAETGVNNEYVKRTLEAIRKRNS